MNRSVDKKKIYEIVGTGKNVVRQIILEFPTEVVNPRRPTKPRGYDNGFGDD